MAGQKDQIGGGLGCGPPVPAHWVGPVRRGDETIEQMFLNGGAGGECGGVAQLGGVGQAESGAGLPGVVDGAGEAGHQRGAQRPGHRRGRAGGQRGADRRPAARPVRAGGFGEVGGDGGRIQGGEPDTGGAFQMDGLVERAGADGVAKRRSPAAEYQAGVMAQGFVDGDQGAAPATGADLVESVEDG